MTRWVKRRRRKKKKKRHRNTVDEKEGLEKEGW